MRLMMWWAISAKVLPCCDPKRARIDPMKASLVNRPMSTQTQGLTLVHVLAQLERFLWDRGCV